MSVQKKKHVVQDNRRENELAEMCGLIQPGGRISTDAFDEYGNHFELKSTSKGAVSTARDFGYKHLDKYSRCYWIVADFEQRENGHEFTGLWFLAPKHMSSWLEMIRAKLDQDRDLTNEAVKILTAAGARPELIERTRRLCTDGALLNDPNIPKGYIRKNGVPIFGDAKAGIAQLVERFPIISQAQSK